VPTFSKTWTSAGVASLGRQSCAATVGEALVFNFTLASGSTNVTGWTFKATLSAYPSEGLVRSWADAYFSSKTSGGAFTLTIPAADTAALASRSWALEIRRLDSGSETVLSLVYVTLADSGAFDEVPVSDSTLQPLSAGGTEANLSATGPGVIVQASVGAAFTVVSYATLLTSLGAVPTSRTLAINGTDYDLSENRSWTIASAWGSITGTLSAQTDLQAALDGKAASTHTHAISDVTGLQTAIDGKAASTILNGLTISATTGTLAIANGKTLTVSNTLTFTGTDGSSLDIDNVPVTSMLTSDATVTSSTTFTNSGISVPVVSGTQYILEGRLRFEGSTSWSFKTRFNGVTMTLIDVAAVRRHYDASGSTQDPFIQVTTVDASVSAIVEAVDLGANTFTTSGRLVRQAATVTIAGSTGNDGTYTVTDAVTDSTDPRLVVLTVAETIPDATVDGTISWITRPAEIAQSRITAIGTTLALQRSTSIAGFDVEFRGVVVPSASGTLAIQFAQNSSSANTVSLKRGSYMVRIKT
jgi:hypothetical protein